MTLDRRRFLGVLVLGAAAPAAAGIEAQERVLRIRLADHPALREPRGAVRLHPAGAKSPLDVLVLPEGGFAAVWPVCTHAGCQVRPEGWELFCPCHGSIFARDGSVLSGPALEPLRRLPLSVTPEGDILITLIES